MSDLYARDERTLSLGESFRQAIKLGDPPRLHPLVHGREQG